MNKKKIEKILKEWLNKEGSKTGNTEDLFTQECLHDSCPECHGTGTRRNGNMCVHNISCPCPKCTPRC